MKEKIKEALVDGKEMLSDYAEELLEDVGKFHEKHPFWSSLLWCSTAYYFIICHAFNKMDRKGYTVEWIKK